MVRYQSTIKKFGIERPPTHWTDDLDKFVGEPNKDCDVVYQGK